MYPLNIKIKDKVDTGGIMGRGSVIFALLCFCTVYLCACNEPELTLNKDQYIVEITPTILRKKQKLKQVLEIIDDPALQDKINLKIQYEELPKYKNNLFELMKEGYKFAIELDNSLKDASEIEKLTMFSYIVVPKKVRLYKEIIRRYKKADKVIFE